MQDLQSILNLFVEFFIPNLCILCNDDNLTSKEIVCYQCMQKLPTTGFENIKNNIAEQTFWGRTAIQNAAAHFYFDKGGLLQKLVHSLKYSNRPDVGIYLGNKMGEAFVNSERFKNLDMIIPVPLSKSKLKKRGYNQAYMLAKGIHQQINIPVEEDILIRNVYTTSQTKKHRTERWLNVNESFTVATKLKLANKHILLVDDVLTTGATLEACCETLISSDDTVKISIATLAIAHN